MLIVSLSAKFSMRKKERVKLTLGDEKIYIYVKRESAKNKVGVDAADHVGIDREYLINGVWKSRKARNEGSKKE